MNCFFHSEETAVASCVDCGKGLCQTCAAKYTIAICDDCNLRRNTADKNLALKKFIPSLVLFIVGFIAFFMLMSTEPLSYRIFFGTAGGWALGGAIYGMYLTRTWFRPKTVHVKTSNMLDANDFFKSAGSVLWILVSCIVGPFAMMINLIKLIIAFVKAKKVTDLANVDKTENG